MKMNIIYSTVLGYYCKGIWMFILYRMQRFLSIVCESLASFLGYFMKEKRVKDDLGALVPKKNMLVSNMFNSTFR